MSQQPALQIQSSHAPQPHDNSQSYHFVRRLITSLVLLFVFVSVISLIAWLIVHPLLPVFTVNSLIVSNFTFSNNSRITADYESVISIRNPNKKVSLFIDRTSDISLMYKATLLAKSLMEAVHLERMSQQNRSLRFSSGFGKKPAPFDRSEFNEMSNNYWSKRVVNFNVRMMIRAGFKSGILPRKTSDMKVSCMNLVVQFSSAAEEIGNLNGGKNCLVRYA